MRHALASVEGALHPDPAHHADDRGPRPLLLSVGVIIPALNEAEGLRELLPLLSSMGLGRIIVADNGSTDATADVAIGAGATHVYVPQRGYGAACFAGMQQLDASIGTVVFLDADLSDDPTLLPTLVRPILAGECDFVIGTRVRALRARGSMTLPQVFGNVLATWFIRIGWGHRYGDLGPFRAIRRDALARIDMQDRAFGWTAEMQIRAVEEHLRIRELPVPYRRRRGKSKISGTVRGVVLAGYWILRTCFWLWVTSRARAERSQSGKRRR